MIFTYIINFFFVFLNKFLQDMLTGEIVLFSYANIDID